MGLPTTISTSIASYHVHIDSDSDHASGQLKGKGKGKGIAEQFNKSPGLDGLVSPFSYCGRVSGWNDEYKVVQLVSILMSSL